MGTIGELGEFGLIGRLTRRLPQGPAVELGPGDDAAVVRAAGGRVVATTDLLTEGRHFRRDWSAPEDVGHKAAAQNLADIVAMGARPTALLIGLAVPPGTPVEWLERLYAGLAAECERAGAETAPAAEGGAPTVAGDAPAVSVAGGAPAVSVAGGDVVSSDTLTVAVTALGELDGAALTRSGARPGDLVAVRGTLGHSAAGFELLRDGRDGPPELIRAHLRPRPPYAAGREARELGATALIDVSDGLLQDLGHIAGASGVCVRLDSAAFPADPVVGPDRLRLALAGGEDHAFAATLPAGTALPDGWTAVGHVTEGSGVVLDDHPAPGNGWDHFRS